MYKKDEMILQSLNLMPRKETQVEGHWGTAHFTLHDGELVIDRPGHLRGSLRDNMDVLVTAVERITFQADVQAPQDSRGLFSRYPSLQGIQGLAHLDTSRTTSLADLFAQDTQLHDADYKDLDTSNVTNMHGLFDHTGFTNIDIQGWDVSQVTDMSGMFAHDKKLKSIDLMGIDTKNVQDTRKMFQDCSQLEDIYHLDKLSTDHYKQMEYMFGGDGRLKSLSGTEMSHFYRNSDMSLDGMF